ncbi:FkbM family methyltransferase [Helicobacter aurati]|uniref:FkbM family methyltransferase n=1 Tax=Helicobacter aurati TaxID=137778 RepID=A0A3D8JA54_9HELI|nr:FkbM family methyltransferase [Helicobacter aurati]RDU73754.1 FkbM family methyltransferase [Helicobacter aurati]
MQILSKETHNIYRVTKLLGIPFVTRIKNVMPLGKTEYIYKVFGLPVYRRVTPSIATNLSTIQFKLQKIESLLNMLWLSKMQNQIFSGQLGQDAVAYSILRDKKEGFFVDIGAHDGISINNTYLFERLGWKGFCVEANPHTFEILRQNRQCDVYNFAVFSKNIGMTNLVVSNSDCSVLDTLEINLTQEHQKRMQGYGTLESISVSSITLNEIMQNYPDISHIDFLSLDVEGGELDVLYGIDFSKYSFGVMTIEHNYTESQEKIIQFLRENGYRVLMQNGFDMVFVRDLQIQFGY